MGEPPGLICIKFAGAWPSERLVLPQLRKGFLILSVRSTSWPSCKSSV